MTGVTPVQGRPLCWLVQSRTDPDMTYLVDWSATPPNCTCPQHHKTAASHLAKTGENLVCWHMEQAMLSGWANYVETVKEHLAAE